MTYGYSFQAPFVSYSVINRDGELVHTTPITIEKPVFMHDFAVSSNYTLFLDFPITLDIERAIAGGPALGYEEAHGSRIGVMPRFGTDADVRWFEVKPGVIVHTALTSPPVKSSKAHSVSCTVTSPGSMTSTLVTPHDMSMAHSLIPRARSLSMES